MTRLNIEKYPYQHHFQVMANGYIESEKELYYVFKL